MSRKRKVIVLILVTLLAIALFLLYCSNRKKDTETKETDVIIVENNIVIETDKKDEIETEIKEESLYTEAVTENSIPYSYTKESFKTATLNMSLSTDNFKDSIPFNVFNMLPGDVESKKIRLDIYHDNTVRINAYTKVENSYEMLAEVLRMRLVQIDDNNEVLYDGLVKDFDYKTTVYGNKTSTLLYEADLYLDTSVGNEYQNKEIVFDLIFSVESEDQKYMAPHTGVFGKVLKDNSYTGIILAGAALIYVIVRRKVNETESKN